jgi:hypothetical protein
MPTAFLEIGITIVFRCDARIYQGPSLRSPRRGGGFFEQAARAITGRLAPQLPATGRFRYIPMLKLNRFR